MYAARLREEVARRVASERRHALLRPELAELRRQLATATARAEGLEETVAALRSAEAQEHGYGSLYLGGGDPRTLAAVAAPPPLAAAAEAATALAGRLARKEVEEPPAVPAGESSGAATAVRHAGGRLDWRARPVSGLLAVSRHGAEIQRATLESRWQHGQSADAPPSPTRAGAATTRGATRAATHYLSLLDG
jgi:hypothetical protein